MFVTQSTYNTALAQIKVNDDFLGVMECLFEKGQQLSPEQIQEFKGEYKRILTKLRDFNKKFIN